MNVFTSLAASFRDLSAAKTYKVPRTHDNDSGGQGLSFGPESPVNSDSLLSLEEMLERELYELTKRINRAFRFGLLPSKGAPQARWLRAHIEEIAAWNPSLAAEAEQVALDIVEDIAETLDRLYGRTEPTSRQTSRLVERFEPGQATVPIGTAARLLSNYLGIDITDSMVRRAAKSHFGLAGKRDGVEHVRLDKALTHFYAREIGEL